MSFRSVLALCMSFFVLSVVAPAGQAGDANRQPAMVRELGPELTSFVGFIDDEEAELHYHLENNEITTAEYQLAKTRLDVQRTEVLRLADERGEDSVPELSVLLADELTQILPEGLAIIKGHKAGDRVSENWLYRGTVKRGVTFYVFERVGTIGESPAPRTS